MTLSKLSKYLVILSIIPAVYFSIYPGRSVAITMLCSYPLILVAILKFREITYKDINGQLIINIFYIFNFIILIRGILDANSYQDWTTLLSSGVSMALFMPFTIYFGVYNSALSKTINSFLIFGLAFAVFFLYNNEFGSFIFTISPIYLLILIIPYMNKKFGIFIITLSIISFFILVSNRSNLLNILVAYLIMSTFFLRRKAWGLRLIKIVRFILIVLPLIFILLGTIGVLNIFSIGQSNVIEIENNKGDIQNLTDDSRTSIYMDVFSQLKKDKAYIFGLGLSGKTKTSLTDLPNTNFDLIWKEGRRGTESGMLNYILYGGVLGGIIYYSLFIVASYYGVYKSKNWLAVMIGLWVAFKGFNSFLEDPIIFSIKSIFIFIAIGMCFNQKLRDMTNIQIKFFFRHKVSIARKFI